MTGDKALTTAPSTVCLSVGRSAAAVVTLALHCWSISEAPSRGQHRTILMAAAATTQRQPLQHAHKLYAVEQQAGNSNSPASVSGNSSERSKAARQRRKTRPFPVSDAEKRKEGGMEGERARVHGESEKGHESEPRSASPSLTSVAICPMLGSRATKLLRRKRIKREVEKCAKDGDFRQQSDATVVSGGVGGGGGSLLGRQPVPQSRLPGTPAHGGDLPTKQMQYDRDVQCTK